MKDNLISEVETKVKMKEKSFLFFFSKMFDLFRREIQSKRVLTIFVEEKVFVDGNFRLVPFDEKSKSFVVFMIPKNYFSLLEILFFVRIFKSKFEAPFYLGHFFFSPETVFGQLNDSVFLRTKSFFFRNLFKRNFITSRNEERRNFNLSMFEQNFGHRFAETDRKIDIRPSTLSNRRFLRFGLVNCLEKCRTTTKYRSVKIVSLC